MGSSFGRDISSAFKHPAPVSTPGIGDGIPGNRPIGGSPAFQQAFGDMMTANMDSGIARTDPLASMIGQAPKRDKGGFGDVLSAILAVAADATDPEGRNRYTSNLAQQWGQRGAAYDAKLKGYQDRQQMAGLPGMTEREMAAYIADPKAWGSNMSRAATSRYDAATLNPGDQRFLGEGNGVYQAPTRGQQFAQALNLQPGTEAYDTAIRDQEMGAQGPTAFQNDVRLDDHRTANQQRLEGTRQQGRVSLEGIRQGNRLGIEGTRQSNRMNLRGAPTFRDVNGAPPRAGSTSSAPRMTTATDGNGNKVMWNGKAWVPVR